MWLLHRFFSAAICFLVSIFILLGTKILNSNEFLGLLDKIFTLDQTNTFFDSHLLSFFVNFAPLIKYVYEESQDLDKMIQNYKIVTLCGSTRFKEQFLEAQKRLTLEGCIVISVGLFGHSGDEDVWKPGVKEMLDDMHLRKIDLADEVFVINVGGYIGESTRREIAYAERTGKTIKYLEP